LRVTAFPFLFITSTSTATRRILTAKQTSINQLLFFGSRSFCKFLQLLNPLNRASTRRIVVFCGRVAPSA
jgi:hypothetical protein